MSTQLSRRNNNNNNNNNWLDDFFDTPFDLGFRNMGLLLDDQRLKGSELSKWNPQTDISETEDRIKITASLPGLKKEDVKIEFDDDTRMLKMHGEYKQEKKDDNERYHRVERHFGRFERSFRLPKTANVDNIHANMKDGVLYLDIPKMVEQKKTGRMINIQ